jgi:hypothetical protein
VEGGGGSLTVSGVSRNRGSFVKCVAIQKRLEIPALELGVLHMNEFFAFWPKVMKWLGHVVHMGGMRNV